MNRIACCINVNLSSNWNQIYSSHHAFMKCKILTNSQPKNIRKKLRVTLVTVEQCIILLVVTRLNKNVWCSLANAWCCQFLFPIFLGIHNIVNFKDLKKAWNSSYCKTCEKESNKSRITVTEIALKKQFSPLSNILQKWNFCE